MRELRFPYPDAVFIVEQPTQDPQGRRWAVVSVQSPDGVGYLASPRRLEVFTERDWQPVAFEAARNNGLGRQEWLQRTGEVRIAIWDLLQTPGAGSSEAVEAESDAVPVPPFPEAAWKGLFRDYRDLVGPTTEAPDVYHYFCFALAFGATLARRVFVYHAFPLFPNFFVALVGRTGITRKDTARNRTNQLFVELNMAQLFPLDASEDPKYILLPGIGSAEGLIEKFSGDGKVVVAEESELLALMTKARREATGNLIPQLTNLFDSPALKTLPTRGKPVTAKRMFFSLLCGTTPKWLQSAMNEHDAYGGFANRFIFCFGEPKAPIAFPPKVDAHGWDHLKAAINATRGWAGTGERELDVAVDATELFANWYANYHTLSAGEGLLPALAVRFQSFAWKLGLLYAAQDEAPALAACHLEPALQAVDWLWESNRAAFTDIAQHGRELDSTIIQRLRDAGDKPVSKRGLYRSLHVSAKELAQAIGPLLRLGIIEEVELPSQNGSLVEGLRAIW